MLMHCCYGHQCDPSGARELLSTRTPPWCFPCSREIHVCRPTGSSRWLFGSFCTNRTLFEYNYDLFNNLLLLLAVWMSRSPPLSVSCVHRWIQDLTFNLLFAKVHIGQLLRGWFFWQLNDFYVLQVNTFDRRGCMGGRKCQSQLLWYLNCRSLCKMSGKCPRFQISQDEKEVPQDLKAFGDKDRHRCQYLQNLYVM